MRVFDVRVKAAVEPIPHLRRRIETPLCRLADYLAAVNARLDEKRALRDRANQERGTVDAIYWVSLR